ncbi:GlxA family transcriptional regulator [Leucobacter chinensis]|uniref:GlxA family transcriptional regulator n=1 Tax=Leucobacter chinensis TaxID=2851010 RepID=UPI0020B85724|nr:helix-turn-helix domain-containing protein [Leucobacter chinensis]
MMVGERQMHRVAIVVSEGSKAVDVAVPAQVFSTRASMPYEVRVCTAVPGAVQGADGLSYTVTHGLEALEWAETIFVPGFGAPDTVRPGVGLVEAVRRASERGARIAAISTGAFVLAEAGLLDGKRATTHWHYSGVFAERYPEVDTRENVLFVDEGVVLTSAGGAAGLDLCLHILRADLGVSASNHAARRVIAPPYRSGGQAQLIERSVPDARGEQFAATRQWALERLSDPLTVGQLAAHAHVTERTFARKFLAETGYTPMQWIMRARVDRARELLEASEHQVDQIAGEAGFGTPASMRAHFKRVLGMTPLEYRYLFTG